MNQISEKILKLFENSQVLSILESPKNYIVAACPKDVDPNDISDCNYAVNKKTFEISEFSYFLNPDEYAEACDNVLYRSDKLK